MSEAEQVILFRYNTQYIAKVLKKTRGRLLLEYTTKVRGRTVKTWVKKTDVVKPLP